MTTIWALGDYHRFAKATVWQMGPVLVEACGIRSGQRVLDVAAGSGNVALRAAQAGADVVASDVTPENFAAGRLEAQTLGVSLDWVEADAQDLPFADDSFDVVTSAFGVMFAPDHYRAAAELVRVCRPGGTIGLLTFTPVGLGGQFFAALAPHLPPAPPDALSPALRGDEAHLRKLFGSAVDTLDTKRGTYASPHEYVELFRSTFGPVIAASSEALDQALLRFATEANRGPAGGPAEYPYEYLLSLLRTI